MLNEIEILKAHAEEVIAAAKDEKTLEEVRVQLTGRRSRLREIMSGIGSLPAEQRPAAGQAGSELRSAIEQALASRRRQLKEESEAGEALDVTLPGRKPATGKLHPLTRVANEVIDILRGMGFAIADGPEIEDEYHNFDALNTPANHPARDLHATIYLENGELLRTQTSTVQIRVMEQMNPPVRVISPGRCYRRDNIDATHHVVFHQIEGLYVDKGVSMADLKGTLTAIGRGILGEGIQTRLRPHFFPFTEPSVECDFSCSLCEGKQRTCRVCKGSGWIEVAGAGMVDPNVFEAVGYDPEVYTGFAFGLGFERIEMIRRGIDDIRLFLENDLRFTRQF
ncbi:MAG: phenylalanine--tRNA ligase subunit alpha [Gemmatimonadetes bacterium]|nr:phenylalanine--tRNA ligase subunit alpha [Gemmatimonadota bacterium]